MKWYLSNTGTLSQSQIDDSIELTETEAQQVIDAKRVGKLTLVKDASLFIRDQYSEEEQKYIDYKADKYELDEFEYADDASETIKTAATYQDLYDLKKITEEKYLEYLSADMRMKRDSLLAEVDRVATNQIWFASLNDEQKTELAQYRQALLDVPQQSKFPQQIDWPEAPAELSQDD